MQTKFIVETSDGTRGRKYKQEFTANMSVKGKPKITKCKETTDSKKDWTKITFYPDFSRFSGMTSLDTDIISLFTKRA